MLRDFMPGECTIGKNAAIFARADRLLIRDSRIEGLAQKACANCIQLPNCTEQRNDITRTLQERGAVRPIVGAIATENSYAPNRTAAALREPAFRFNLSPTPASPHHEWEIIRQALRTGQIYHRGKLKRKTAQMRPTLYDQLIKQASTYETLNEAETKQMVKFISLAFLRYREARQIARINLEPDIDGETIDLSGAEAMQHAFIEEVAAFQAMNAPNPVKLAQFHRSPFYAHLVRVYNQQELIPLTSINSILSGYPRDPWKRLDALCKKAKTKGSTAWIEAKIEQLYEPEQHETALSYARTFLRRDYVCFTPDSLEPKDTIQERQHSNAQLTWNQTTLAFPPQERDAILSVFGLDRLVLGTKVDQEKLKLQLQTDDLAQYVDKNLLPYTLDKERGADPASVLEMMRHWSRDNRLPDGATPEPRVRAALASLHDVLSIQKANPDEKLNKTRDKNMRILLRRIEKMDPAILTDYERVRAIVLTYLDEVAAIRAAGVPDHLMYQTALSYSPAFCRRFMTYVNDPQARISTSQSVELLNANTGQPVAALRYYQQLVRTMEPAFKKRNLSAARCRITCSETCRGTSPEARIVELLGIYDKTLKRYGTHHPFLTCAMIEKFCFNYAGSDPIDKIETWLASGPRPIQKLRKLEKIYRSQTRPEYSLKLLMQELPRFNQDNIDKYHLLTDLMGQGMYDVIGAHLDMLAEGNTKVALAHFLVSQGAIEVVRNYRANFGKLPPQLEMQVDEYQKERSRASIAIFKLLATRNKFFS